MAKVDGVLREMRLDDVAVVLDVQEPAAVVGLAVAGHDELVERIRRKTRTRPWLSVYSANRRGRAFWEKLGWAATGEHSRGDGPPHAELVTYELRPESNWFSP